MLGQDETIFRALYEGGAQGIVVLDAALLVERANPHACRLLGCDEAEFKGRSLLEWADPMDRPMLASRLDQLRASDPGSFEIQCRFFCQDGTFIRLRVFASAGRSSSGECLTVLVLVDITDRVESVLALAARTATLEAQNSMLTQLDYLGSRLFRAPDLQAGLQEILTAAVKIAGADRGNIQLYDRATGALRIIAQRGFDRAFLDAFASVRAGDASACGRALARGERVVVGDVESDREFAPYRAVMAAADVRAVQSTPLLRWNGGPLGMLSTYYRAPRNLDASEAAQLDLYSLLAAAFIEHWDEIDALRSRQRSLDLALDASGAGTWSFDAASGQVSLGPRASRMLGLPAQANHVAAEQLGIDANSCAQARARLAQLQSSVSEDDWDIMFARSVRGNDARWLHTHGRAERDSDGALRRVHGIVLDVSTRRKTEDELLASAAQLRSIIDTAIDSIVVIDEAGIIQAANLATRKSFGYSAEELLGQNVRMLMPATESAAHDTYIGNYVRTGIRKIIGIGREVQGVRKNGSMFPIDLAVAEWHDGGGRRFFTGILRDITLRKQHEHALATAQRLEAVGQLASGVSHDFNNLLAVVSGNLELADSLIHDELARSLIRKALDAVQLGSSFSRRLLSLSRRRPASAQVVDVNARVDETSRLLVRTMGERIALEVSLCKDPWRTLADPGEVDGALLNLAINARDAMPNGGRLSILTANTTLGPAVVADFPPGIRAGDYVVLTVRDDGDGMSPETLKRATEPFFTTKAPGKGTGLGLSTTSSYLANIGGFLSIKSEVGKGCAVNLFFPRAPEPLADAAPGRHDDVLPRGNGQLILVVEDDDHVREVVVRQIRALGYKVEEARSGAAALDRLQSAEEAVQLVVSDVVMPGSLSGYELARWVVANRPLVGVILSSGYNEGDRGDDDQDLAGIPVLAKPYTREDLARTIAFSLRGKAGDG